VPIIRNSRPTTTGKAYMPYNGRFDGYWELSLKIWDLAAGLLIAQEAGAVVTGLQSGQDFLNPPHAILAANAIIHPQMLEILRGGWNR